MYVMYRAVRAMADTCGKNQNDRLGAPRAALFTFNTPASNFRPARSERNTRHRQNIPRTAPLALNKQRCARRHLGGPICAHNQGDKDMQLPKILKLDDEVKSVIELDAVHITVQDVQA